MPTPKQPTTPAVSLQKSLAWDDAIPDGEDEAPSPYEETYRDGSAKNLDSRKL